MIKTLSKNLFGFEQSETPGEYLFFRLFEIFILGFVAKYVLEWAFYIPKLGEVVLPLGLANYIDVEFMFNDHVALINAILILIFSVLGFFGIFRYSYLAAIILFHFQYVARFSQGEISHGSNMVGMALLAFALSAIFFQEGALKRKFAMGLIIFFIGLGYTSAAMCKLIGTGFHWIDGRHLWLWIGERKTDIFSQYGNFHLNKLQELILAHHWMATLTLAFGLVAEFFGFAFWFKKTRPFMAFILIGMHFGIFFSMNISFKFYVFLLLLTGVPWANIIDKLIYNLPSKMRVKKWAMKHFRTLSHGH